LKHFDLAVVARRRDPPLSGFTMRWPYGRAVGVDRSRWSDAAAKGRNSIRFRG